MEWATINFRSRGGANRRGELSPARAGVLRAGRERSPLTYKTVVHF